MSEQQHNLKIVGRATSPGIIEGHAFVYREKLAATPTPYEIEKDQVDAEMGRIEQAMESVLGNLKISTRRMEKRVDAKLAAVFQAHGAILKDPALRREIREEVEGKWSTQSTPCPASSAAGSGSSAT